MSNPERSNKSLFLAALEIQSDAERQAFLEQACEDNEQLRAEIESLLDAHVDPPEVLKRLDQEQLTIDRPITEQPGMVVGPYKLLQQIGEGGMGVVYMAEQAEPVERRVALKIIKPGMDTRQVIARFEAEQQALAMMDHSHIAKVFDAGATGSGRPYFVMELVKGVPITEYCDQQHLTPRERLELFIPVCHAVQHAHQKGIIHRDIKPSNILVGLDDGQPVPKVIDFGVAKALSQKLTEKTMFTQYGQVVGTLEYMSPEQANLNQLDIDTRSDVYSLGVLLYELLAGATPFDRERLRSAGFEEMLRIIREEEPPKPSTRFSTIDTAPSIAAHRHLEPRKLSALIRGELDWIVMKALEKDRTRRYESANEFASDIRRYLNDEAVEASPPSAVYRLRKFLRRNKTAIITASLFAAALLAGIAGTAWQAIQTRRAERAAEARFQLAKEAVDEYLNRVAEDEQLKNTDLFNLRKKLLEAAVPFYEKLANEKSSMAAGRAAQGDAWYRLGRVHGALGEHDKALRDFERMRDLFQTLVLDDPANPKYRERLAVGHENCSAVLMQLSEFSAANETVEKALDQWNQLVTEFPHLDANRNHLALALNKKGILLRKLGQESSSLEAYTRSIELSEKLVTEFPKEREYLEQLARVSNDLSLLLRSTGQTTRSKELLAQALDCYRKLAAEMPDEADYQKGLGGVQRNLANLLNAMGEMDAAQEAFEQSLAVQQRLTDRFPSVMEYRRSLASTHNDLGHLLQVESRDLDRALREYQTATEEYERLDGYFEVMPDLGRVHHNMGWLLRRRKDYPGAKSQLEKSIAVWNQLVATHKDVPSFRAALATSWNDLGVVLWDQKDLDGARKAYQQALELRRQLADASAIIDHQISLAGTYCNLGQIEVDAQQLDASLPWFAEAQKLLEGTRRTVKQNRSATQYLRNVHWCRAEAYEQLDRFDDAVVDWAKALELSPEPNQGAFRRSLALALARAADDRAIAAAEELTLNGQQPRDLMTASMVFAITVGQLDGKRELQEQYAVRAMELLELASSNGAFKSASDVESLKTQHGFDSIRSRLEFQRFIELLLKEVGSDDAPPDKSS